MQSFNTAGTIQNANTDEEEPPPSYDSVVASAGTGEPPPSYQSIFGEMQRTRKESNGFLDFLKNLAILLFSTLGCIIGLAVLVSIPITCIVLGVQFRYECPIQPKIPLFLIVFGAFGVLRNLSMIFNSGKKRFTDEQENQEREDAKKSSFEGLIDCFLIAWFICGNVWVYRNYKPDYNNVNSDKYCHPTLYLFAFWLNTAIYIVIGTSCCCFCCVACLVAMFDES
ncbi:transmembrane protein 272-like isoform X2 [Rhopilema esculentum]|uniref:transmembrane protein 272-like isoform X2 n=1 Tax=Rhopilema esculentum TaxID=499914 RepID=UPI0031D49B73